MNETGFKRSKKAITINRVSSAEQAQDDRNSLPSQVKDNRKYCEDKKLKIVREFTFDESASADERKKFDKAIKFIEQNEEPIAIVVDRVDRFQRSFKESVEFDDLRKEGKAELHFREQNLIVHRNSSAYELMAWDMWVMFARNYVLTLSANVRKGQKGKIEKGIYPGYTPTGYINISRDVGNGKIIKEIQIDENKSKYIIKCFELYATGRYTTEEIANIMRNSGFTMKGKKSRDENGKPIFNGERKVIHNDIQNILHNPFYYGEFRWPDPDTHVPRVWDNKNTYPTLISKKLYDEVQKVFASGGANRLNGGKNCFRFQKLLECSFCGSTLAGEEMSRSYKNPNSAHAKNKKYYHCSNGKGIVDPGFYERKFGTDHSGVFVSKKGKNKGQTVIACPQRWWKEEEIEEFVLQEFDILHYDDSTFDMLKEILQNHHVERIEFADDQIKGLERKCKKNETLIQAFTQKFATVKNKRLEADMMKEYDRLKREQETLKEEIKIYEETKIVDTDQTIDTMKLCCNLRKFYDSLDFEKQRELLNLCFSKIVAGKGTWRINGGRGKRVTTSSLYPVYNEPFATLRSIKIDELVSFEEERRKGFTKEKDNLTKKSNKLPSLF